MGPRFRGDDAAAVGRGPSVASAKPRAAADFYQGKTLRIVISTGVAGGFGEYARLLSEHIGKHIAGRPHVIVQSMPGAGGLLAANYPLRLGAAGRHHHRHHQLDRAVCAAVGQQGRAFRHLEVQLARHPRSRRRRVHALAHLAGEDLGRHAGQGAHGRKHRRRFGDGALPGDAQQAVRDQDQGDRGLQGRQRHRPRHRARRARRPLRHPSHLVQGAASRLVRRTQDSGAGHHRGAAACRSPRHARGDGVRAGRDDPCSSSN